MMTTGTSIFGAITPKESRRTREGLANTWTTGKTEESIPMRKAIAKALTWRVIGTAEIFAISFWTTGHIATAGHTAGLVAITSVVMYVVHELVWSWHEGRTEMIGLPSIRLAPGLKVNNEAFIKPGSYLIPTPPRAS
jgi:uncharacterized membrane protein